MTDLFWQRSQISRVDSVDIKVLASQDSVEGVEIVATGTDTATFAREERLDAHGTVSPEGLYVLDFTAERYNPPLAPPAVPIPLRASVILKPKPPNLKRIQVRATLNAIEKTVD